MISCRALASLVMDGSPSRRRVNYPQNVGTAPAGVAHDERGAQTDGERLEDHHASRAAEVAAVGLISG